MPQTWKPTSKLARAVKLAGFFYDPQQDIIFSRMNAWQRSFGYAYSYDVAAPVTVSGVLDCEPFFFRHGGRLWMIELWKGQYGLETGAEIGVYDDRGRDLSDNLLGMRPHDPSHGRLFKCANNAERLRMSFTLERKGVPLFTRGPQVHWWLTGFRWGVLSRPEDLVMKLTIEMPVAEMRQAFVAAVKTTGYPDVQVHGAAVSFTFDKPKTHQPRQDPESVALVQAAEANNTRIVTKYQGLRLPNNDPNLVDGPVAEEIAAQFAKLDREQMKKLLMHGLSTKGHNAAVLAKAIDGVFDPTVIRRLLSWLGR